MEWQPVVIFELFNCSVHADTLPVGTATVERSFSAMNRVLSWSRNSLNFSMASDLMVLSLSKDLLKSLDLDKVLDHWVHQKDRVVPFN